MASAEKEDWGAAFGNGGAIGRMRELYWEVWAVRVKYWAEESGLKMVM